MRVSKSAISSLMSVITSSSKASLRCFLNLAWLDQPIAVAGKGLKVLAFLTGYRFGLGLIAATVAAQHPGIETMVLARCVVTSRNGGCGRIVRENATPALASA